MDTEPPRIEITLNLNLEVWQKFVAICHSSKLNPNEWAALITDNGMALITHESKK